MANDSEDQYPDMRLSPEAEAELKRLEGLGLTTKQALSHIVCSVGSPAWRDAWRKRWQEPDDGQ